MDLLSTLAVGTHARPPHSGRLCSGVRSASIQAGQCLGRGALRRQMTCTSAPSPRKMVENSHGHSSSPHDGYRLPW